MAEKVVLEIDVNGLANSVLQAKANVDSYKLSVEELTEAYGENSKEVTIATAQLQAATKEQKQLEGQLLRTTQAQQALGESIIDLSEAYDAENKSIDQNRKVYNALYAEYIKADKAGREKLQPTMKKINDTLKEQEKAVGDTRRNVGNYTASITEAFTQLKGIGQVVDPLRNLGSAFSDAGGGVKGFGAALATTGLPLFVLGINTLITAFQSFKPIVDALEQAMGGLSFAFGSGFVEGTKLTKAVQDLEDAQRDAIVTNALYTKSINELEAQAANKAANDQDRIKALKEANKLRLEQLEAEKKLANEQKKIADAEVKNSEERAKRIMSVLYSFTFGTVKTTAEASDEVVEKQKNATARIIQLEDQANQAIISNNNKVDLLTKQLQADRQKRRDEELQRIQQFEQRKRELAEKGINDERIIRQLEIDLMADGLEKELRLFDLQSEQREKQLYDAGASEIKIAEWRNSEIAKIEAKYAQKKIADKEATNRQIQEQEQKLQDELIAQADRAAQAQADADLKMINNLTSFVTDALSQAAQLVNAFADQNIEALENQFQQGIIDERTYNQEAYDLKVKAFKETKALNITQAVIATLQSSLNAFNSGLQAGGPFGLVLGAIFAAAAAAFGGAQIALIAKQQPPAPQFAEGGGIDIEGKSHSEGGEDVYVGGRRVANIEGGEKMFILKKSASRHIDALGGLNMAFGGRSWKDSPVSHAAQGGAITDGGFAIRATSQEANTMATLNTFAETIVSRLPAPVVSITEFENKQKSKNKSVRVSEL
jgi:DNA repair exonuclease SbcCD ATPase subunit